MLVELWRFTFVHICYSYQLGLVNGSDQIPSSVLFVTIHHSWISSVSSSVFISIIYNYSVPTQFLKMCLFVVFLLHFAVSAVSYIS